MTTTQIESDIDFAIDALSDAIADADGDAGEMIEALNVAILNLQAAQKQLES